MFLLHFECDLTCVFFTEIIVVKFEAISLIKLQALVTEHEISTAHKNKMLKNKDISCFKTLRCCIMLIYVKCQKSVEHENSLITSRLGFYSGKSQTYLIYRYSIVIIFSK